jgi:hypothetical protein
MVPAIVLPPLIEELLVQDGYLTRCGRRKFDRDYLGINYVNRFTSLLIVGL